jgi:hypothetical protein
MGGHHVICIFADLHSSWNSGGGWPVFVFGTAFGFSYPWMTPMIICFCTRGFSRHWSRGGVWAMNFVLVSVVDNHDRQHGLRMGGYTDMHGGPGHTHTYLAQRGFVHKLHSFQSSLAFIHGEASCQIYGKAAVVYCCLTRCVSCVKATLLSQVTWMKSGQPELSRFIKSCLEFAEAKRN